MGNKFNFANEHCIKWGYFSCVFLLLLCVHRVVSWFIKSQNVRRYSNAKKHYGKLCHSNVTKSLINNLIIKFRNNYEMNSFKKGFLVFPSPYPTHVPYQYIMHVQYSQRHS